MNIYILFCEIDYLQNQMRLYGASKIIETTTDELSSGIYDKEISEWWNKNPSRRTLFYFKRYADLTILFNETESKH